MMLVSKKVPRMLIGEDSADHFAIRQLPAARMRSPE